MAFVDACKEGEVMKAVTSATKLVWLEVMVVVMIMVMMMMMMIIKVGLTGV